MLILHIHKGYFHGHNTNTSLIRELDEGAQDVHSGVGFGIDFYIFNSPLSWCLQQSVRWCCENITTGISLCCDSAFAHNKEFSIFKFPERFLEISWRNLTTFTTFAISTTLIIYKTWLSVSFGLSNVLLQCHDFKTPFGDYDKWWVFGKNELKNNSFTHCISCVNRVLSFHKLQCICFWSTSFLKKPKDAKQDNSISH